MSRGWMWVWTVAIWLIGNGVVITGRSVALGNRRALRQAVDHDQPGRLAKSSNVSSNRNDTEDGRLLKTDAEDNSEAGGDRASLWYDKARTFGQTEEERNKVEETLQRLQMLMKSKIKVTTENTEAEEQLSGAVASKHPHSRTKGDQWATSQLRDYVPRALTVSQGSGRKHAGRFRDSDDPNMPHNPEEFGRFFEGDIVLSGEQAEAMYEMAAHDADGRKKRKFVASPYRRWDATRPIDYSFDGSHTPREQKIIELSLQHWENVTCLNFNRRDDPPRGSRIVFTDVDGCASNVGRNPSGDPQYVSLASECLRLGVIAHEIAHSLGFWHEQSRPDRDSYVDVMWRNIDSDSLGQFLKEKQSDVASEGIPYDYGSIMHYRSKAFAKSDDQFTLLTDVRDYQTTIGQRDQLSFSDIRLMNKVYCAWRCSSPLNCQRGGYTDPRSCAHCRCPDGFTGKLCEKVMSGYGANCGGAVDVDNGWSYIHSPNYPNRFEEGQECSWLIKAPVGQHVQLQFIDKFDLYCKKEHSLCMDYVEVKNSTDWTNTGMRYCCDRAPSGMVVSSSDQMLVLFRSFYRSTVGFKARVRAAPKQGSKPNR